MKILTVIEVSRDDITPASEKKKLEELNYPDFYLPMSLVHQAHSVYFRDDDGRIKVLKDRYSCKYVWLVGSAMEGPMIPPIKIEN